MSLKRIIPCLDIKDGKTVKGVNFVNFVHTGDPVEMAIQYSLQGASELVFLDITATVEGRKTFIDLVKELAKNIYIPFTVGGGISELGDVEQLLKAGATKVSINSAAIKKPSLINEIANQFDEGVCVVAIDANYEKNVWRCYINGGSVPTELTLFDWAKEVADRGASEILFTSITHDGVKNGYPNEALAQLTKAVSIPIIASGGAGKMEHFKDAFIKGKADAALAASVFHFGEISIPELKEYLKNQGIYT